MTEQTVERDGPGQRVAQCLELVEDRGRKPPLRPDVDRRGEVGGTVHEPARRPHGCRDIDASVHERRDDLGVDLRLGVAPHRAGDDPRPRLPGPKEHPGQEGVEGPLARLEDVRMAGIQREIRAAVLVVDARFGIDHAGPEAHVVRLDQADRVAVRIHGRQVDRSAAAGVRRARRDGRPVRVDRRRQGAGVVGRQQPIDRDLEEVGIGQPTIPVGHRELRRLDAEVDPTGVVDPLGAKSARGRRLERVEDLEQLQSHHPRRVRRMGGDPDPPIVDRDRLGPCRAVGPQVVGRDRRPDGRQPTRLALAEIAIVEVVEADQGQALEGRGKSRQTDPLGGSPRAALRPIDLLEPGSATERVDDGRERPLHGANEAGPRRKPVPGQLDRRCEDLGPRQPAVAGMGVRPRPDGAGHRDRERTTKRQRLEAPCAKGGGVRPAR